MKKLIPFLFILAVVASCADDPLEVDPPNATRDEVLQTPSDALLLLNSCYEVSANSYSGDAQNLSELLGDNLAEPISQDDYTQVFKHRTDFFNGTTNGYYKNPYIAIFRANTLIDVVDDVDGFPEEDKLQMKAEARFIRALGYYELVKVYAQPYGYQSNEPAAGQGDNSHLGLVLRTTPNSDAIPRSSVQEVYNVIEDDLLFCVENLREDPLLADSALYLTAYASRLASQALLAKVYFNSGRYNDALPLLDVVINEKGGMLDPDLDRFKMDASHPESIFEFVSQEGNRRSDKFRDNYRSDLGATPKLICNPELYALVVANPDDVRDSTWFDVINPGEDNEFIAITKFNKDYFNVPYLHLTDMMLMRAEALCRVGGSLSQALSDINQVRARAGLNSFSGSFETAIDQAILQRRIELVAEGSRIMDIKRLGAIHDESITIRETEWYCNGMVIQFPNSEGTVSTFEYNPPTDVCQ